jgi:hypothetical protein
MKTASQPPIKGFFRIIPKSFPNSDAYGIGYEREGEDAFATEDRVRSGNTSFDFVGVLWSIKRLEEQKPLSGRTSTFSGLGTLSIS